MDTGGFDRRGMYQTTFDLSLLPKFWKRDKQNDNKKEKKKDDPEGPL